jgi:hypothetical protein
MTLKILGTSMKYLVGVAPWICRPLIIIIIIIIRNV